MVIVVGVAEHLTSTPLPGKKAEGEEGAEVAEGKAEEEVREEEEGPVLETQLQLAVEVSVLNECFV